MRSALLTDVPRAVGPLPALYPPRRYTVRSRHAPRVAPWARQQHPRQQHCLPMPFYRSRIGTATRKRKETLCCWNASSATSVKISMTSTRLTSRVRYYPYCRKTRFISFAGRTAGLIVDTPASFASGHRSNDDRQRLIRACVDAFKSVSTSRPFPMPRTIFTTMYKVNTILVVGHEKLNVELNRNYGSRLTVVKIPKSGGVRCPSRAASYTHY